MAEMTPATEVAASLPLAVDPEDGEQVGGTTGFVVLYLPPRQDPAPRGWRPVLRRFGGAVGAASTAALFAAVVLFLFIGYGLVDNRWYHVLGVEGGSMAPTILPGDLIVLVRPPAVVEPGMILTLEVDGKVVTHRVVEVLSNGRFVTKGDANNISDDFSHNQVRVVGQYAFRIPAIGSVLSRFHRVTAPPSGAWLLDRAVVGGSAEVAKPSAAVIDFGPLPISIPQPDPGLRRIAQLGSDNSAQQITVFVRSITAPRRISEIPLSSVELCFRDACIPNSGAAADKDGRVAVSFDPSAMAGIVGASRGVLTFTVQGSLRSGGTFAGRDTVEVVTSTTLESPTPTPDAVPVVTPDASPTPTAGVTLTPTPDVVPTPAPISPAEPTPTPTPNAEPAPTPTSAPTLDATLTPDATPGP